MFKIKLSVLGSVLTTEKELEDSLVVYIAEVYNHTVADINGLALQIQNITEQMGMFGETGFEKELEFIAEDSEGQSDDEFNPEEIGEYDPEENDDEAA